MATAPDGRFVVAWVSDGQDGGGKGVYARLYDASGAPQTGAILVNTTTSNNQEQPAVAMDGAGNFVVVWSGNGVGDGDGVFVQRFNATGVPQGTEFRVNGAVSVGFNQSDPDVAMETNGDFAVVWQSNETSSIEIWLQRYQANGMAIGGPSLVSVSGDSENDYNASIAMDDDGDFVVAWEGDDGSNEGIRARRYSNAGVALDASPIAVNATTSGHQERPDVAMDAVGNFVVVWDGESPSDSKGVYGRRFSAAGVPLGADFRVNTQTSDDQTHAAVAMSGDGRFVVTWDSKNQDGSSAGALPAGVHRVRRAGRDRAPRQYHDQRRPNALRCRDGRQRWIRRGLERRGHRRLDRCLLAAVRRCGDRDDLRCHLRRHQRRRQHRGRWHVGECDGSSVSRSQRGDDRPPRPVTGLVDRLRPGATFSLASAPALTTSSSIRGRSVRRTSGPSRPTPRRARRSAQASPPPTGRCSAAASAWAPAPRTARSSSIPPPPNTSSGSRSRPAPAKAASTSASASTRSRLRATATTTC